jgi:hypothetical protein
VLPRSFMDALQRLNGASQVPLVALAAISDLRRELDRLELLAAVEARDRGTSWSEIGDAVGISKQAAAKRWREDAA